MDQPKQKSRKRKFTRRSILLVNLAFIFLLLISYLAAYINPKYVWWMELFALSYGVLLGINLFFIFFWAVLRKYYFIYSLAIVLLGISHLSGIFQIHPFSSKSASHDNSVEHPQLKVMSYNVHLFDLYNWFNNIQVRGKMFRFFTKAAPDIICFQEFYSSTRTDFRFENADTLRNILSAPYRQIAYTTTLRETDHWGIATYSKYPIVSQQVVHFTDSSRNVFIFCDVKAGVDTFRVFNFHLESDKFQPADYRFVKDFDIGKNEQSKLMGYWKRVVSIVTRLKDSAIKRSQQLPVIKQYINESPYPVIVCGDFNDVPSSYCYHQISSELNDAFKESGNGFGKTYLGAFPSFRIDYILHSKEIESTAFVKGKERFSDHYPVSCVIQRKK